MLRLKQAIGACILVSALGPTGLAHAATYYVATSGSNSNPGTSTLPWRTVAYAASKMVAGDTTYVKGGTYNEGSIRFGRTGTQSAPIKLLNYPGAFPRIRCVDSTKHLPYIQNLNGSNKPIGWITIEGFEITNCFYGIKYYNLHDSVIRRNWIHHNPMGAGIQGNGTRILIDRNRINSNAKSRQNHGIYANGTAYTVTNNLIYDNYNYGIQLNGSSPLAVYSSTRDAGPEFALSNNWVIANNTFAYQTKQSGIVVWGSTCNNARIENNIFYENAVTGSSYIPNGINFVSTSCKGITIKNNLAFASGSGGKGFLGPGATAGVHYTQSGNIVNTLNPKFVNAPATLPSSPNFALASGSPAIDKGLSLSATKSSYPGTARPKLYGYDIGAYEYYGSTQLAAPTSLQAGN